MSLIACLATLCLGALPGTGKEPISNELHKEESSTPHYLYKVLSMEDWRKSQGLPSVSLPAADDDFIHFSREDQLDRLLTKYWADEAEFIILKIDTTKLPGKMVFEANPGGSSKYYHLYNGCIPSDAIAESKIVNQELH